MVSATGWCHWHQHYVKLMGLFKNPFGNFQLNSFKSSEVCHYTVLNGTLVIPWVTSVPIQVELLKCSASFDP